MARRKTEPATINEVRKETLSVTTFREKFSWQSVRAPRRWSPVAVGEELLGYYGGRTLKSGSFGQYEVALVHGLDGTFTVTGVEIIQLLDAAMIEKGHPVRIVWRGLDELPGGKSMKRFELLVAEGEPLTEDELPRVDGWGARRSRGVNDDG